MNIAGSPPNAFGENAIDQLNYRGVLRIGVRVNFMDLDEFDSLRSILVFFFGVFAETLDCRAHRRCAGIIFSHCGIESGIGGDHTFHIHLNHKFDLLDRGQYGRIRDSYDQGSFVGLHWHYLKFPRLLRSQKPNHLRSYFKFREIETRDTEFLAQNARSLVSESAFDSMRGRIPFRTSPNWLRPRIGPV